MTTSPTLAAPQSLHLRTLWILSYKAWLETRARFLASAAVLALLGLSTVVRAAPTIQGWEAFHGGEQMPYALYVWLSLFHGYLLFLWVISAVILGLGGLVREHELGTSGFTLALPVSRGLLVTTRAAVGIVEVLVLALISGVIVSVLSPLSGYVYPLSQSVRFGLLLGGGGLIFYALGFLLSHLLRGEYAAPAIGLAFSAAFYVLTKLPGLEILNVFDLMSGKLYMVHAKYLLGPVFPFMPLAAWMAVAIALLSTSAALVRRREF
ncbi:MAG: ABC transporter permease [Anaerolineae bacterium]|nr:ABC transporter permease [Gemmatimonadaceae bacterium]